MFVLSWPQWVQSSGLISKATIFMKMMWKNIHWNYCAHIESNHFYESDVELHMYINSNFWVRKADLIALEWIRAWWPIPHLYQNLDDFITELPFEKSYFLQGHGHLNGRRHKLTLFSLVAKMSAARHALSSFYTSAISRHLITVPVILSMLPHLQQIYKTFVIANSLFPPCNFDNFTLAGIGGESLLRESPMRGFPLLWNPRDVIQWYRCQERKQGILFWRWKTRFWINLFFLAVWVIIQKQIGLSETRWIIFWRYNLFNYVPKL